MFKAFLGIMGAETEVVLEAKGGREREREEKREKEREREEGWRAAVMWATEMVRLVMRKAYQDCMSSLNVVELTKIE